MDLIALLYVSYATLGANQDASLAAILDWSRVYNPTVGISGALLFTGTRFAQILEGEAVEVHRLLANIRMDSRHADVVVLQEWPIQERLFQGWALAYAGPSDYVERVMSKPLDAVRQGARPDVGQLVRLMVQFAATDGITRSAE